MQLITVFLSHFNYTNEINEVDFYIDQSKSLQTENTRLRDLEIEREDKVAAFDRAIILEGRL